MIVQIVVNYFLLTYYLYNLSKYMVLIHFNIFYLSKVSFDLTIIIHIIKKVDYLN